MVLELIQLQESLDRLYGELYRFDELLDNVSEVHFALRALRNSECAIELIEEE